MLVIKMAGSPPREKEVLLLNPCVGDKLQVTNTDTMLQSQEIQEQPYGKPFFLLL